MNTPTEADKKLAEAIGDSDKCLSIGSYSDGHYDSDEVAQTIADHMQPEREAHRKTVEAFGVYGSHMVACAVENNEPCNCGFDKALAAIEKVIP